MSNPFEDVQSKEPLNSAEVKELLTKAAGLAGNEENWTRSYAQNMVGPLKERTRLELTVEEIDGLLHRTKEAHTEYEKGLGQPDSDWAGWYAQYIVEHLGQ